MKKFAVSLLLLSASTMTLPAFADDVATPTAQPKKKVKVAAEVHATLAFTECVAKLLNSGLAAQEARQLCLDTISN
jgi:hypothetical protein